MFYNGRNILVFISNLQMIYSRLFTIKYTVLCKNKTNNKKDAFNCRTIYYRTICIESCFELHTLSLDDGICSKVYIRNRFYYYYCYYYYYYY